ncbi:hypothetical protein E2320_022782, partial [Naja naja]
ASLPPSCHFCGQQPHPFPGVWPFSPSLGHNPLPKVEGVDRAQGPRAASPAASLAGCVRISGRVPLCFASTAGKRRVLELHQGLPAGALDFSFRGISFMQGIRPNPLPGRRPGLRPIRRLEGGRLLTQAVRLNNNTLSDLTDFPDIMEKLLEC